MDWELIASEKNNRGDKQTSSDWEYKLTKNTIVLFHSRLIFLEKNDLLKLSLYIIYNAQNITIYVRNMC